MKDFRFKNVRVGDSWRAKNNLSLALAVSLWFVWNVAPSSKLTFSRWDSSSSNPSNVSVASDSSLTSARVSLIPNNLSKVSLEYFSNWVQFLFTFSNSSWSSCASWMLVIANFCFWTSVNLSKLFSATLYNLCLSANTALALLKAWVAVSPVCIALTVNSIIELTTWDCLYALYGIFVSLSTTKNSASPSLRNCCWRSLISESFTGSGVDSYWIESSNPNKESISFSNSSSDLWSSSTFSSSTISFFLLFCINSLNPSISCLPVCSMYWEYSCWACCFSSEVTLRFFNLSFSASSFIFFISSEIAVSLTDLSLIVFIK